MPSEKPARLMSLDVYRGFVMLAMASSGLALTRISGDNRVLTQFDGTEWAGAWETLWSTLEYQLSHVAWTGCSAWDLIQPSFMFMVGVSLPFSMARRDAEGTAGWRSFLHAVWRSVVLVGLGVALSSRIDNGIMSFTFANVLCQIGLGYSFLYLLRGLSLKRLTGAASLILIGYGAWFALQPIDQAEVELTKQFLTEQYLKKLEDNPNLEPPNWSQFREGSWAAHWNKHTNAAAQVDRDLLNRLPRLEEPWNGKGFWANTGGYQTLNFIPSLATMIFGLMAGLVALSLLRLVIKVTPEVVVSSGSALFRDLAGGGYDALASSVAADWFAAAVTRAFLVDLPGREANLDSHLGGIQCRLDILDAWLFLLVRRCNGMASDCHSLCHRRSEFDHDVLPGAAL